MPLPSNTALAFIAIEVFAAICALAFGKWRERAGAGIIVAMVTISFGFQALHLNSVWWNLLIDILSLGGFIALVWKSPHPWPLWAAGCQLFAVGLEVNALLDPNFLKYGFRILLQVVAYAKILALLTGVWTAFRRQRNLG